ncbi:helix-turn-helix domain-containing protein [Nocardia brasiliensis]|uniref:helix-turn-helix domain-containing protein n=1 Tax=Nocardia brasiliensis TaxID=37326 RepID=UPI00056508A3|nr:helix-turn-helix domain-containing protein [Nocardia brasiliensis]
METPQTAGPLDWDTMPLFLPVPWAAKLMGLSRSATYRLVDSGDLPVRRMGGRVYVITAKLRELAGAA